MRAESCDKLRTGQGTIEMVCYRSFEQARLLREQWDRFAERVGADLYSSFDWCETWWRHFGRGRQLEVYVASVEDKIVAVLPLFREKLRWGPFSLRVVRLAGCDHLTTLCSLAVDADWTVAVAEELIARLNRSGTWDVIHMGELVGYCKNAGAFAEALRGCNEVGEVVFGDNDYPHMVFDIPGDFEEFLGTLSQKERHNIRRDERYFNTKASVTYRQPESREDFEQAIDRLIKLHTEYWSERGRLGHFGEWPGVAAFHREIGGRLLESGKLILIEIYQDGKLGVSEYSGQFGSRVHWITNARAPSVVSTRIGFCAILRRAIAGGAKQIDSLAGHFDYKRRLGAQVLGVKNITAIHRRLCSRLRFRVLRALIWFVDMVYFRLWFWRLAPWIRRRYPGLQVGWLKRGIWVRFLRSRFLLATRSRRSAHLESGNETLPAGDAN